VKFSEEYRSLIFGFPPDDVFYYGEKMMGGENETGEITEMHLSAFQEIVNQMASKFSQELQPKGINLVPSPVEEAGENIVSKFPSISDFHLLTVNYSFGDRSTLLKLFMPSQFYNEVRSKYEEPAEETEPQKEEESVLQFQPKEISSTVSEEEIRNIEILKDVPLEITVVLGRTRMKIKDVLKLGKGSVITLDRQVGERVDLMANNKLIAKGEVVVIGENFGFRITEILSPEDRLKELEI
jgi:flagellar motor switch protein FliN/FliY